MSRDWVGVFSPLCSGRLAGALVSAKINKETWVVKHLADRLRGVADLCNRLENRPNYKIPHGSGGEPAFRFASGSGKSGSLLQKEHGLITLDVVIQTEDAMIIQLPLDEMTNLDKIAAMERIWDDLCRDAESIPSPKWHQDVLLAREREVKEGRSEFMSLDRAKDRIRAKVK